MTSVVENDGISVMDGCR